MKQIPAAGLVLLTLLVSVLSLHPAHPRVRAQAVQSSTTTGVPTLVAYYPFDNDLTDQSGNKYHGEKRGQGSITYVDGKHRQAASFDDRSWMVASADQLPVAASARSMCLWAKSADGKHTGNAEHLANWGTVANSKAFGLMLFHGDTWWGYSHWNDTPSPITADTNWHFLCVTYVGSDAAGRVMKVYVDGKFSASRDVGELFTEGTKLYVGVRPDETLDNTYDGLIDELRIYDGALTDSQITDLYEGSNTPRTTVRVTDSADSGDKFPGDGLCRTATNTCTLRAAIQEANVWRTSQGIQSPERIELPEGTYNLTIKGSHEDAAAQGDLDINNHMEIVGNGRTKIYAMHNNRVFAIGNDTHVHLQGLWITGGFIDGDGGGLYNSGQLTISNSTISKNIASNTGGGIHNANASGARVILINSTISGNSANRGGGIHGGIVDVYSSTVSSNTANQEGGGIYADTIRTKNSLIATNVAKSKGQDCLGTLTSSGYTWLGTEEEGYCTIAGGQQGNKVAKIPGILPLADNNGSTPTHAVQEGSKLIDEGDPNGCEDADGRLLTTDQRGLARQYDGNQDGITRCDIGAFEFQPIVRNRAYLPLIVR